MTGSRFWSAAAVGALLALACFSERVATAPESAGSLCHGAPPAGVVQIRNLAFHPAELRVSPGTQVRWVNCDGMAHSATSDAYSWDTGLIAPGTAATVSFAVAGQFAYHCEPHPSMRASVTVE
jgi:plastocyanin